jgi:glycosyltransferase involved in cell wall biosynthesis
LQLRPEVWHTANAQGIHQGDIQPMIKVFMMDLWCQVPFYNAYLCQAIEAENVNVTLGSTKFHLEPDYYLRRGLTADPGVTSSASTLRIRNSGLRRAIRFTEFCINALALALRFLFAPPDVVHVQWIPLAEEGVPIELWLLKLAKFRGAKIVYTVHNVLPHDPKKDYTPIFLNIYHCVDRLICHTQETADRLVKEFNIRREKIDIIPHGPLFYDGAPMDRAAAKARLGLAATQCTVLYQGLVRPYKGLDFLLDAWQEVQTQCPDACLVIAGRGEAQYMEWVRARVQQLGLADSVRLDLRYITTEEISVFYQACDISLYLHKEITQSGALMTGIPFGRPVITTALAGFKEALVGYKGARSVAYGDVDGLARLLQDLINNPGQRKSLSSELSTGDCDSSWREIARKTKRCYEQVLVHSLSTAKAAVNEPSCIS